MHCHQRKEKEVENVFFSLSHNLLPLTFYNYIFYCEIRQEKLTFLTSAKDIEQKETQASTYGLTVDGSVRWLLHSTTYVCVCLQNYVNNGSSQ